MGMSHLKMPNALFQVFYQRCLRPYGWSLGALQQVSDIGIKMTQKLAPRIVDAFGALYFSMELLKQIPQLSIIHSKAPFLIKADRLEQYCTHPIPVYFTSDYAVNHRENPLSSRKDWLLYPQVHYELARHIKEAQRAPFDHSSSDPTLGLVMLEPVDHLDAKMVPATKTVLGVKSLNN